MALVAAKRLALILIGVVLAGASASAQTAQERAWCEGEDAVTIDQRIEGCSAVIKAGRERGEKLAEAFNTRGIGYRLKGEYDRAIGDYNQAIRINAKFATAYNNRAIAYDTKGDYDRAIADYEQAIKLKPSAETYFNRGNAHLGKSHYDHAIDDYNQAIKLKPDFAAAFDNRCWARAVVGILKPALADCNQALRLMPNNPATLDSRGFVFLKMTNFDAAVSDYDAALRSDPKRAFALYGRGLARLRNNDPSGEADVAAAKAIQADIAEEYARYGMPEAR
ncbi:MAG TPA: tetratricopeptide repeat protein [Xanthobacteraceae bacterium]|nr:tetratricopeptide repeat protein [Xanthobacteraceae bacterium]